MNFKNLSVITAVSAVLATSLLSGCAEKPIATSNGALEYAPVSSSSKISSSSTSSVEISSSSESTSSSAEASSSSAIESKPETSFSESSNENKIESVVPLGEWGGINCYGKNGYAPASMRITSITRGQAAIDRVEDYNSSTKIPVQYSLDDDRTELVVIDYEVKIPKDFPAESYGVNAPSLTTSIVNLEGKQRWGNLALYSVGANITKSEDRNPVQPGETIKVSYLTTILSDVPTEECLLCIKQSDEIYFFAMS